MCDGFVASRLNKLECEDFWADSYARMWARAMEGFCERWLPVRSIRGKCDAMCCLPLVETEYVKCDFCGSEDHELLFSKVNAETGLEFHLVQCRCGMALVNPMPVEESVGLLYPSHYHEAKPYLHSMYARMMEYLPVEGGGRLLDVGCGRGDFIHYAATQGWEVEGVDLIKWEGARDVPIRVGDFVTMDIPEESFHAVTAWALLEHVRCPSLFIEKISRLLRPDGRFVFLIPNASAPGIKYSCAEDVPRHLWLFTPETVEGYLHRYGMRPLSMHHDDSIYTAYPFGLVRRILGSLTNGETRCSKYQNKSVAILRNREIKGNLKAWLAEVVRNVGPFDLALDALDMAVALALARISKIIGNYGVLTVTAEKANTRKTR